jgi:hemerythrin superfamily protein
MARGLDALELLRKDHQRVEQMFRRFERSRGEEDLSGLIEEACVALSEHADLEEQYFYPVVLEMTGYEQLVREAQIEHATARQLIQALRSGKAEGAHQRAMFRVLVEYVRHHVQEEEERIFPLVRKTGVDLEAFGQELAERKGQPAAAGRKAGKAAPPPRRPKTGAREEASAPGSTAAQRASEEQRGSAQRAAPLRRSDKQQRRAKGSNGGDGETHVEPSAEDNAAYKEANKEGLSRTTLRAKWIESPDEHEDRPGQSLATRSHEVIRQWAEERRAAPATTPGGDSQRPRVLRFNFPGFDKDLQEVSWDAWFSTFDERDLVFIYQEHMKAGNPSNFFKFDSPGREQE